MSSNQPPAEQANQGGAMSKFKKTLLFLLVLVTGGILSIATIKYFPSVNEKVDAGIAKLTGKSSTAPVATNTPAPPAGLDADKHKSPSRATPPVETVANNGTVELSEVIKDVRRHKPEEILRREHLLVNGKLPDNLENMWIYMPQLTEVPDNDTDKVCHSYRLNHQAIADAGLDARVLNGLRFDVVHHAETETLSNDLDSDERYFFGGIKVKEHEDGRMILEIPTGFAPGAGRLDNRTTTKFYGVPDNPE